MKRSILSLTLAAAIAISFSLPASSSNVGTQPINRQSQSTAEQIRALMTQVNAELQAAGANYMVDYAEYITPNDSGEVGQVVFFANVGNKQLAHHFVPGDPRRGGGTDITYIVDQAEGAIDGLTTAQTTAAIDRAMDTWDGTNCSTIPITSLPNIPATDIGVVEFLNGLGGSPIIFADITHAGWLPGGILSNNVIAVTFTFIFVNGPTPTDIDNNGKADVAFREILYNNFFTWNINANIDVETVALHESGHGLSQAHFGTLFQTTANAKFHFSPRAVMNAGYTGVQQNLSGSDNAGHCSIWGSWPNN